MHQPPLNPWPGTLPDTQARLEFLRSPAAHGEAGGDVDVVETHMSWVFLSAGHVLKLKKPVRYPFLDFSSVDARRFYCEEELRLNRRLAPGVYLGVRALQWHDGRFDLLPSERLPAPGVTLDWLVWMRRLPEHRMLHRLVASAQVAPADIDPLVARLADFYRGATALPLRPDEYLARFHREQASNREVMLRPQFHLAGADAALDRLDGALATHADFLRERCAAGRIVEGHGDLRPEHVCMVDPPVVIDCLEFNASLRQVDPFDEAAFLGFECAMAGAEWIAPRLVAGLSLALDDRPPPALLHLYTALRALLRARLAIAHLLDAQPRTPSKWAPLAQRYVQRALAALDGLDGVDAPA